MTTGGNGNNSNNSGGATNLSGLGSMGSGGNSGGGNNDRIEVIKLPPTITSNGVYNAGKGLLKIILLSEPNKTSIVFVFLLQEKMQCPIQSANGPV